MIHKACLKDLAKLSTRDSKQAACPECTELVSQMELRENCGQEFMEELAKLETANLISKNQSLVNCTCGNIMEVVQGDVDYNMKDDLGKLLTREAAIHMSKFRIRCGKCQKNFCC